MRGREKVERQMIGRREGRETDERKREGRETDEREKRR